MICLGKIKPQVIETKQIGVPICSALFEESESKKNKVIWGVSGKADAQEMLVVRITPEP